MREEAERTLPSPSGVGASELPFGRETGSGNREAKARKGNAPGRMKPRRARDAARGEIQRRCTPTGRGMKPLKRGRCWQQCLKRRKRLAPLIQEGSVLSDRFEELVFVTANLGEVQEQSRLNVCPTAVGR
jgi:hypothetical protein